MATSQSIKVADRRRRRSQSGPDITNVEFGRLTALYETRVSSSGHSMWQCRCICGSEKEVARSNLFNKHVRSCGCFRREFTTARNKQNTKYHVNEDAFRARSPEMAYWLGFIIADGCLCYGSAGKPKSPSLQVNLAVKDAAHLHKLNAFLKSDMPIRTLGTQSAWGGRFAAVSYRRQALCESLRLLGVEPRKSGRETIPLGYEDDPDLMRGLVDGDGWLFHGQRSGCGPEATIGLCGSRSVCEAFAAFVMRRVGGPLPPVRPDKSIWRITAQGQRVSELTRILYSGACYALDRKAEIATQIMGITWPVKVIPICTVEGCGREARGLGYCFAHWKRFRKYGSALTQLKTYTRKPTRGCGEPDCTRQHYSRGYCRLHWERKFQ